MADFVSPKIIFGKGALKKLADDIEGEGVRAAIITDKFLAQSGVADKVADVLKRTRCLAGIDKREDVLEPLFE